MHIHFTKGSYHILTLRFATEAHYYEKDDTKLKNS